MLNRIMLFLLIITLLGGISGVEAQSKAENFTEIRGIDLHPNGQVLALGALYKGQGGIWFYDMLTESITGIPTEGKVSMVSWRPDGNVIAASNIGSDKIEVYDVASKTLLFDFYAASSRRQVIWSADGSTFMTQGATPYWRDGSTGEILQSYPYPDSDKRFLKGIAWLEKSNRLYGTVDVGSEILVWDVSSGEYLTSYDIPFTSWGPELNHAEDLLAVGSEIGDGSVLILDALTGDVVQEFTVEGRGFIGLVPVWSPDDSKIAVSSIGRFQVWEVATGQLLNILPVNEFTNSQNFTWASDGESLIYSDGRLFPRQLSLLSNDVHPEQLEYRLNRPTYSPDGRLIAFSNFNSVEIYTPTLEKVKTLSLPIEYFYGSASTPFVAPVRRSIVWSPDGTKLAVSVGINAGDGGLERVMVWDTSTWQPIQIFEDVGWPFAWSGDSQLIAASGALLGGLDVKIFDVQTGRVLEDRSPNVTGNIHNLSWNPVDASQLLILTNTALEIWDFDTRVGDVPIDYQSDRLIVFSPDGDSVALTDRNSIQIWDTKTWTLEQTLDNQEGVIEKLYWLDVGILMEGSYDSQAGIYLWDRETDSPTLLTQPEHSPRAISPDLEQYVLVHADGASIVDASGIVIAHLTYDVESSDTE